MQNKKRDQPWMPFYFGDWRKAPEIRALDLDVRMIWFEMLGFMWESTDRGFLTINGKSVSVSVITKMVGVEISVMESAITQMEMYNVFSRRDDGAIYCRRMVNEEKTRTDKSNAGKAGMQKRYAKKVEKTPPAPEEESSSVILPVIPSVITEPLTFSDNDNDNDNKDSNKGDIKLKWGVQGDGNFGGKEEGLEIYDSNEIQLGPEDERLLNTAKASDDFRDAWKKWVNYIKYQLNFEYKATTARNAAFETLVRLSNYDESICIEILNHTMSNGWKQFIKPEKNNQNGKRNNGTAAGISVTSKDILQPGDDFWSK